MSRTRPTPEDSAKTSTVDLQGVEQMEEENRRLAGESLVKARAYIERQKWCTSIRETRFGTGLPGVLCVWLMEFDPPIAGTARMLWVFEGDLPSAYCVVDEDSPNPFEAIETYCQLMDDWIESILQPTRSADFAVFPVEAAATAPNASALRSRIDTIRNDTMPSLKGCGDWGREWLAR